MISKKKGIGGFNLIVLIFFTMIMIYAWAQLSGKYSGFDEQIGEKQFELIRTFQKAENALFYIDQSAKYSLQQSVYDLAKSGGISEIGDIELDEPYIPYECGRYYGNYVWLEVKKNDGKYTEKDCFDESSARLNLEYIFNKKLNEFLVNYPEEIPTNNYNYEIKGNLEAVGIAKDKIKFYIKGEGTATTEEATQTALCLTKDSFSIAGAAVRDTNQASKSAKCRYPAKGTKIVFNELTGEELVDFTDTNLCKKGSKCILSIEAGMLIFEAQKIAEKKGRPIVVREGYRTRKEQEDLWNGNTPQKYNKRFPDEVERRNYVCYPYGNDVEERCTHLSGNAVDVQFEDKEVMYMSEKELSLLNEIMTKAGWIRYGLENRYDKGEAWHFECCNTKRYVKAKYLGVTATI